MGGSLWNCSTIHQECWHQEPSQRPSFEQVVIRLRELILKQEKQKGENIKAAMDKNSSQAQLSGLDDTETATCMGIFNTIDEDEDGYICVNDLAAFIQAQNIIGQQKASRIMAALDRNADGSCDSGEWLYFCLSLKRIGHLSKFISELRSSAANAVT